MNILKTTIAATLLMGGVAHAEATTGKMLLEFCMAGKETQQYALGLGYVVGAMEANEVASALGGQVKLCAPAQSRRERFVRVCSTLYELDSDPEIDISIISAAVLVGMTYSCNDAVMENLWEYELSR